MNSKQKHPPPQKKRRKRLQTPTRVFCLAANPAPTTPAHRPPDLWLGPRLRKAAFATLDPQDAVGHHPHQVQEVGSVDLIQDLAENRPNPPPAAMNSGRTTPGLLPSKQCTYTPLLSSHLKPPQLPAPQLPAHGSLRTPNLAAPGPARATPGADSAGQLPQRRRQQAPPRAKAVARRPWARRRGRRFAPAPLAPKGAPAQGSPPHAHPGWKKGSKHAARRRFLSSPLCLGFGVCLP